MAATPARERLQRTLGIAATGAWAVMLAAGLVLGVRSLLAPTIATPLTGFAIQGQTLLSLLAVAWLVARRRRGWPAVLGSQRMLRLCCYPWFLAVCIVSLLVGLDAVAADPAVEKALVVALAFALHAAFVLVVLAAADQWTGPWLARLRRVDVVIGVAMFSLIGLELAVIAWARLFPSPVVWDDSSTVSAITANRLPPDTPYFGFRVNSLGYHDQEFFVRGPGDLVVCMLADSFGVGVVPFDFNYVTVAERTLRTAVGGRFQRVAIHNFGVAAIGMQQYIHIADSEVGRYAPDLVAVSVFVGNDILDHGVRHQQRKYVTLQRWAAFRVLRRVVDQQRAYRHSPALANVGALGDGAATEVPPWVHDPELEPEHMTAGTFLSIEADRVEVCRVDHTEVRHRFARFFDGLDWLARRWGQRLLVLLIPDEFQVDDELWRTLLAAKADAIGYDRDGPQRRITEHCTNAGIAVLDLLPILREHRRGGGPRAYHRRDTHWNATGNRIAGEALGRWLAERLQAGSPAATK